MQLTNQSKGSNPQKVPGNAKNEKPSSPKHDVKMWVKKSKDGKNKETTVLSNGSSTSNSSPKQPFSFRTKSQSFNDREVADSKSKPTPVVNNTHLPKLQIGAI